MERNNKGKKSMEEGRKDEKQRGVCYLGRIPPRMDPSTLRQMLSQYGEIQRWVEFSDKRVAKRVANMLNGEQIGGKKRSSFYYDLWNIKYLSKFNLQEATREQKLALEISAAKERDSISLKLRSPRQRAEEDSGSNPDLSDSQLEHQVIHRFCQKKPVANNAAKTKSRLSGDVLSASFVQRFLVASVISESLSSSETKSNEKRLVLKSPSTLADRILNSYKPNVSEEFSP
nr:pre-rRNA-processing protein esf2-like [Malus domestica]